MRKKNEKLMDIRLAKGFTQIAVAKKAQISVRGYQKYENEGQLPNIQTAIQIADALGVKDLRLLWE